MSKTNDYPRMLFHRSQPPVTVHSEEEEVRMGAEWSRILPQPAAQHVPNPDPDEPDEATPDDEEEEEPDVAHEAEPAEAPHAEPHRGKLAAPKPAPRGRRRKER